MGEEKARWKVKCVIYDCDGVLFDSIETNRKLYNDLCVSIGRGPLTEEELKYVHSSTVYEAIHFVFGHEDGLEQKVLDLFKQVDLRRYIGFLRMEPHLLQTLKVLREKGILTAVNTNRTTSMKHVMERFGLWPYFDMVVTALDVKNPKPHPESVEKIMERFGLNREEVILVGDSEVDRQAALSSGIKFIAYKNREVPNDAFIDDHLDLLDHLILLPVPC